MGKFFGTYERTLDEKKRLQVPTKLVREMPRHFFVLRGFEGCLSVYEEDAFNSLLARMESKDYEDPKQRAYVRAAMSSATELEVDSHGRIGLTAELTARYGIAQEVTIIGVLDHFEIWDSAAYAKYQSALPSYEELAAPKAL